MSSDDQQNLPAVPQSAGVVHTLELPIAEFEGEMVRIMHGVLPRLVLDMEYGYRRGTHVKIELEVEVMGVSVNEMTSGKQKGELVREHTFKVRETRLLGAYTADELDPGVGGNAAANGHDIEDEEEEKEKDEQPERAAEPDGAVGGGDEWDF